jgi:hypothetical protein
MIQQVNLYTDAFKPPKVRLPLEQLIIFPLLLVMLLVAASFALNSYLSGEKARLAELQAKNAVMAERLSVLSAKAEKQRQDDALVAANQRLKHTLQAREAMLVMLDQVVVAETVGFSNTLIALARQQQPGLWLTSIQLGGEAHKMLLKGITTKAELVPAYLQKLRQEASLLGKQFSTFELNAHETQSQWLDFTLEAAQGEKPALLVQPMALMDSVDDNEEVLRP